MRCPFCGHLEDKVVDSRESREGDSVRRRRECLGCGRRFTSYERVEEAPLVVAKKDGRREPFDRQKLLRGMAAACQKRPVSLTRLEESAGDIQAKLMERHDKEVPSRELGEIVMDALKQLDSVAYVRFASIYREFRDLSDFVKHLEGLVTGGSGGAQLVKARVDESTISGIPPRDLPVKTLPVPSVKGSTPPPKSGPDPQPLFPGLAEASVPKRKKA